MIVAVSGSNGFIGGAVCTSLVANGHAVKRIVRTHPAGQGQIFCDPVTGCTDTDALEGVDAVIHLAGESLAGKWNPQKKFDIYHSRTHGTDILARAVLGLKEPPKHFLCASAVGIYGDRADTVLDEGSPAGTGFLADLCRQWEANTHRLADAGIRVVNLRFAMVLDKYGGALAEMLPAFKLGLGSVLGSGSQYMSWISLADVVCAVNFILENHSLTGPVNISHPVPVTNKEFTKTLAQVLKRPAVFKTPSWALNLMFGQFARDVLLSSAIVVPQKLLDADPVFAFEYADLKDALQAILK